MKKSEALNILGLEDGASDDDVKRAHREKIRQNHPDRFTDPDQKKKAEEQTKLINEARDVLLSRKWEPEYGPRTATGGTYGNPYAGARPGTNAQGDPFYGMPFTYVWSSWDNVDSSQGAGAADPFESVFTKVPRKTAKEQYEEAKGNLRGFAGVAGVKLIMLAACALLGGIATGMFIYLVTTVLYAISREVKGCSSFLVIPFVFLFGPLILFMVPSFGAGIGIGLLVFFGISVAYDVGTLRRLLEQMRTYKQKADIEQ